MHQRSGTGLTRKPPTRCCFTDHVQNDSLRYAKRRRAETAVPPRTRVPSAGVVLEVGRSFFVGLIISENAIH
jgi:hypothetical protein